MGDDGTGGSAGPQGAQGEPGDMGQVGPQGSATPKQNAESALLRKNLSTDLQKSMDCGREKGASSWLGVLPITEHGFNLHKGTFQDALSLRYGWKLTHQVIVSVGSISWWSML